MSQSDFTAVYSQMFADMFRLNYQAMEKLRGTTQELHGLVGDAYKFKYMEQQQMNQLTAYNSDIPAGTNTTTAPSMTFTDYVRKDVISEFDQLNFNAKAMEGYAQNHARMIGRREDQYVIDEVTNNAANTIANGGTNLTVEKILAAQEQFGTDEVDQGDLFLVCHWNNFHALMNQTQVVSQLYNSQQPLAGKNITSNRFTFAGFTIIPMGNRTLEGGLSKTGNIRKCIAYSKSGMFLGYRMDATTSMIPEEWNARSVILSKLSMGAKLPDTKGGIVIECDESV